MPEMKRRIIYMDDETWDGLQLQASTSGLTISGIVRLAVSGTYQPISTTIDQRHVDELRPGEPLDPAVVTSTSGSSRMNLSSSIDHHPANTGSIGHSQPAPKPTSKRR